MTHLGRPRCWGYRIDTRHIQWLQEELSEGRLRQGWGYKEGQNLRDLSVDEGARRNLRMLKEVKKRDLLLVPRLPDWHQVAIVEASEDWCTGYRFEIPELGDLGHIFPAKQIRSFVRGNAHVAGDIRATLRNPSRFWNIDHLRAQIRDLCETDAELGSWESPLGRAQNIATRVFKRLLDDGQFEREVFECLNSELEGKDWELVVAAVLTMRYPTGIVDVVQGRSEVHHGTDTLVTLPDITGEPTYAIAVQVKDHKGRVDAGAVEQIGKAEHWATDQGLKVIEKVVVFTRAKRIDNVSVAEVGKERGVQIIFGDELQTMLAEWARRHGAKALL